MRSFDDVTDDGAGRVVVALDGSPTSIGALRLGARIAEGLGLRLAVVTVWHRSELYGGSLGGPLEPDAESMTAAAAATQAEAVTAVLGMSPPDGLERKVLEGPTIATLLKESHGAEMLVLGSRGHGGVAALLLGSVSAACAAHAACAVLVCHDEVAAGRSGDLPEGRRPVAARREREASDLRRAPQAPPKEIVVGVDGTRASIGALRQGARFAESLHLPLLAICASGGSVASTSDATATLTTASRQVFGSTPPRWFHSSARAGTPAAVLGRASEHARMLVIGHSGTRVPTTARESVSSAVAVGARCPIVIFHGSHVSDPESFDGSDA